MDILVERSEENIGRLLHTISQLGEGYARELQFDDFTDEPGAIRIIENSIGLQVAIFVRMNDKLYADFKDDVAYHELEEVAIPYLNSRGLIELKSASVREKDQIDVATLKKISS